MLPGITEPIEQATLSSPLEEVLVEINVKEADIVRKGHPVARLDTRALEVDLKLAKAVAAREGASGRARQRLTFAEQNLARIRQLRQRNAASIAQFDQAVAAWETARATVTEAEERRTEALLRVEVVKAAIEQRTLRAPFTGRITRVTGHVGEITKGPVVSMMNLDHLRTDLHLPIEWMNRLRIGQHYALRAGSPLSRTIKAKLVATEPLVRVATGTFRCSFEINNETTQYPAGFAVRLSAPVDTTSVSEAGPDITSGEIYRVRVTARDSEDQTLRQ